MRYGIRNEHDWALLGAQMAQASDEDQATFFKAFVRECNSYGTRWQAEMQLAAVNRHLTKEERETLSMITHEQEKARE